MTSETALREKLSADLNVRNINVSGCRYDEGKKDVEGGGEVCPSDGNEGANRKQWYEHRRERT